MKILVCNAGSTSLKFKLYEMPACTVLATGKVERVGSCDDAIFGYCNTVTGYRVDAGKMNIPDYAVGINKFLFELTQGKGAVLTDIREIARVGYKSVLSKNHYGVHEIDEAVMQGMRDFLPLAPVHNSAYLKAIETVQAVLPDARHVGVFETAFHRDIPLERKIYGVPYEWYEKLGVRRYGAHGTSHRYVAGEAAKLMGRPLKDLKLVTCHLGAGSSLCAIKNGKSFDTSMGFTPLTGVTMATRSGDVDVSMIAFVMDKLGINSISEMVYTLNKESGLAGISGVSSDMRDILSVSHAKHRARLAIDIFVKDIVKYIGQYYFEMGGIDGIVFTAGIGENSAVIRKMIMERLSFMNITIDNEKNEEQDGATVISGEDSAITMMKIPTNEELMIARDVMELKNKKK